MKPRFHHHHEGFRGGMRGRGGLHRGDRFVRNGFKPRDQDALGFSSRGRGEPRFDRGRADHHHSFQHGRGRGTGFKRHESRRSSVSSRKSEEKHLEEANHHEDTKEECQQESVLLQDSLMEPAAVDQHQERCEMVERDEPIQASYIAEDDEQPESLVILKGDAEIVKPTECIEDDFDEVQIHTPQANHCEESQQETTEELEDDLLQVLIDDEREHVTVMELIQFLKMCNRTLLPPAEKEEDIKPELKEFEIPQLTEDAEDDLIVDEEDDFEDFTSSSDEELLNYDPNTGIFSCTFNSHPMMMMNAGGMNRTLNFEELVLNPDAALLVEHSFSNDDVDDEQDEGEEQFFKEPNEPSPEKPQEEPQRDVSKMDPDVYLTLVKLEEAVKIAESGDVSDDVIQTLAELVFDIKSEDHHLHNGYLRHMVKKAEDFIFQE